MELPAGVDGKRKLTVGNGAVVNFREVPWHNAVMAISQSKLTAQGQIRLPVEVRRKLGVGPGSLLQWFENGDSILVRRAGQYSSEDIHRALFPDGPPKRRTLKALKDGIGRHMRERYARR